MNCTDNAEVERTNLHSTLSILGSWNEECFWNNSLVLSTAIHTFEVGRITVSSVSCMYSFDTITQEIILS